MFKNNFFKGWYFKCMSNDKTIAFIPSYHIINNKKYAFLQIITDNSVYNIPYDFLTYDEKPLRVNIGKCIFSEKGIKLNICNDKINIIGELKFYKLHPIKYDIMGPFKFIPFMQCRHSIYSMCHNITGKISINGQNISFENGTG